MPSGVVLRRVEAAATRPLRRAVLRPHQEESALVYEGDDDPATLHLAAVIDDALVGVCCIAPDRSGPPSERDHWRVRGMAVLPEVRGRGIGTALLAGLLDHAREGGADLVWCNARVRAVTLYERAGFTATGGVFDIPDIGPHLRMERTEGDSDGAVSA